MSILRKQGVQTLDDVKLAFMEADGSISVIMKDKTKPSSKPKLETE
jgi:uncharacterized membrane protein YcaP (DUF421 family)